MRKVYQNEKNSLGLPVAIIFSVGFTALLFGFIPFAHRINKPQRTLELRKASTAELPSPVEDTPPPPQIEEQKTPEAPPEPQLAESRQQIPISADLDVAMGSGGGLVGFGEVHSLAAVETMKDEAFDVS